MKCRMKGEKMTKEQITEGFRNGIDCGQAVAGQFAEETGLSVEQLRRLSACYGGGMMRGETCGAVIAAYEIIGYLYGHDRAGDDEQKGKMLTRMLRFNQLFSEKYEGFMCRELLGADISTAEGGRKINEQNLMFEFCPLVVIDVVEILKKVISEE